MKRFVAAIPVISAAPFEVVTRRQFVINLKVARELGVTIPDAVLKRADRIMR